MCRICSFVVVMLITQQVFHSKCLFFFWLFLIVEIAITSDQIISLELLIKVLLVIKVYIYICFLVFYRWSNFIFLSILYFIGDGGNQKKDRKGNGLIGGLTIEGPGSFALYETNLQTSLKLTQSNFSGELLVDSELIKQTLQKGSTLTKPFTTFLFPNENTPLPY